MREKSYWERQYNKEIMEHDIDYKLSYNNAKAYIEEHKETKKVNSILFLIGQEKDKEEAKEFLYFLTVDYSFPVIVVKMLFRDYWSNKRVFPL